MDTLLEKLNDLSPQKCLILFREMDILLEKLNDLSPQKCLIPFHEVSRLDIQPEIGYKKLELGAILSTPRVNRHMEVALSGVHAVCIFAPLELRAGSLYRIYFTLMVH
jgi:hypothetical protein